ncbi:MAG: VCBS repeat-containing protein [Planctomycetes bacterium]|nr:VCBS repeat-containing protein [Planctomycetota bacterium]
MRRRTAAAKRIGEVGGAAGLALLAATTAASAQVEQLRHEGTENDARLGESVARIGDLDLDGCDDWLVSEPNHGRNANFGRVFVLSGATATVIRTHIGPSASDFLGTKVAGLGDVDGDAIPDYAYSMVGHVTSSGSFVGRVEACSGATGQILWGTDGADGYDWFGRQLMPYEDLDGDGACDLVVSHLDVVDSLEVLSGATGARLAALDTPFDFADSMALLHDIDGDGRRDFAVGCTWDWVNFSLEGTVSLYSGATGNKIATILGGAADYHFGHAITAVSDLDQDGVDDFLVTAGVSYGKWDGVIEVRSGATLGLLRKIQGTTNEERGAALGTCADWDGDGVDDYVATSSGVPPYGVVRVYSSSTDAVLHEFVGERSASSHDILFGRTLATGDWNGDGIGDLLIPAEEWYGSVGTNRGIVHCILGCPASQSSYGVGFPGTLGTPTLSISGDPELGATLTFAADNSLGAATIGWVLIGDAAAAIPLKKGGTLLALPQIVLTVPIDANGFSQDEQLPDDPALGFSDFFLQIVQIDPGAAGGLSMTQGLQLRLGWDY